MGGIMKKVWLTAASVLVLNGCATSGTLVEQHEPVSQLDAGSVSVVHLATMPWDELVDALHPRLHSQGAQQHFQSVLPSVQRDLSSQRNRTAANLAADLGSISRGGTETTTGTDTLDASGNTASERSTAINSTLTRTAAARPTSSTTPSAPSDLLTLGTNPLLGSESRVTGPNETNNIGIDPILQADLATGVHQYFVTQNNYLENAIDACGEDGAWLVRVRLTSQPRARNQPYDIYTRIYFREISEESENTGEALPFARQTGGYQILPILVSDNMERSDTRRLEQSLAQLQASLSGVRPLFGFGGGIAREIEQLNAILGAQYNNLLSVSRPRPDMLEIRQGAQFSPVSRYEMSARSYDLHFLVYGPEPETGTQLELAAVSTFVHAETGERLPALDISGDGDSELEQLAVQVANQYRTAGRGDEASAAYQSVIDLANGNLDDVLDLYGDFLEAGTTNEEIYAVFDRIVLARRGSSDLVRLPEPPNPIPNGQIGVFTDRASSGLVAQLGTNDRVRTQNMSAYLYRAPADSDQRSVENQLFQAISKSGNSFSITGSLALSGREGAEISAGPYFHRSIQQGDDGALFFSFPSQHAMGLDHDDTRLYLAVDARSQSQCALSRADRVTNRDKGEATGEDVHLDGSGAADSKPPSPPSGEPAALRGQLDPIRRQLDANIRVYPLVQNVAGSQAAPETARTPSFALALPGGTSVAADRTETNQPSSATVRIALTPNSEQPDDPAIHRILVTLQGGVLQGAQRVQNGQSSPIEQSRIDAARNGAALPLSSGVYDLQLVGVSTSTAVTVTANGQDSSLRNIRGETRTADVTITSPPSD